MAVYRCGVCNEKVEGDVVTLTEHTEVHILKILREKYPDWSDENGVCDQCLKYLRHQIEQGK